MSKPDEPQIGYAEVNGTRLYYEIAGRGDPLVLVHAGVADHRMWDEQVIPFARSFTVVRYDARGHGHTAKGARHYSWSQDLHGLLKALALGPAILVGSSQGGTSAIDFALAFPEMTRALVAVSATPSGYGFEGAPPAKLLEFMGAYQEGDPDRAAELAAQVWFDGPRRGPEQVDPAPRARMREHWWELLASGALDLSEDDVSERPAVERLAEIGVPTLVITGDQDDPSIIEAGDFMAARIQSADRVTIAGGAHLVNVEQPAAFNRAVLEFLKRQGMPPNG